MIVGKKQTTCQGATEACDLGVVLFPAEATWRGQVNGSEVNGRQDQPTFHETNLCNKLHRISEMPGPFS